MKRILILLLLLLACLSVRAASPLGVPVAIEVRKTNGQTRADLKWPADGDRQYDVLTTTNLTGGAWLLATNAPIVPTNLIGAFQHSSTNRMQFFRVAQRDILGPAITSRYPATNGIGVGRFATLSLSLNDETGVDPSRFALTFNALTLSNGSPGVTATSNSFQYVPGTNAWGDYGSTSAVSFVCADVLGNTTTSAWTFTLEVQPVVTNVLIHLPPPATLKNAALARAAKEHGASFAEGLSIISFETNLIVFSYTGTNHGLYTDGILVSHDPARFFYRQITSLTNDTNSHTVTTYTTNVLLTALVQDGTFSSEGFVDVSDLGAAQNWTADLSYARPFSRVSEFTVLPLEFDVDDDGDEDLRITPGILSINLQGKLEVSCRIKDWQVVALDASVTSQLAAEMRARLEFLVGVNLPDWTRTIGQPVTLVRAVAYVGVVPVWLDLQLAVDFGVEARAEAAVSFETGLDAYASSDFRLAWRPGLGWDPSSSPPSFSVVPVPLDMEFQVSAEAFLYLKPRLSVVLCYVPKVLEKGLASVSLDYRRGPALEATSNPGDPQAEITLYDKWTINAGLTIVGVPDGQLPSVTLLQAKRTVQTWHWPEGPDAAPVFTRHPATVATATGSTVTLEASATGSPKPTYQWFQNGQAIPFQTQPVMTFTIGNSAIGSYTVMARNHVGWVLSNPATVSLQTEPPSPSGMALIPAGSFTMGNSFSAGEGFSSELPLHTVYVSAFYMDRTEVAKALWDDVYQWATNHGYTFDNPGSYYGGALHSKGPSHPVHYINWYDTVKWCNARSEKEGRTPAYFTSGTQTTVYRSGQLTVDNSWVKWSSGYRLPTEAEWEKAARGGASGHRFPWSDTDNITHSRANYYSSASYAYDTSPTRGYHPTFNDGVTPYASPTGYFVPNGYGLYDVAGNVFEWCWDWYSDGYYSSSPGSDPRGPGPTGPTSGWARVYRGGSWVVPARFCRTAVRFARTPLDTYDYVGFRSVLPPSQP